MKKQNLKNLPVPLKPSLAESQLAKITSMILEKYKLEKIICFGSEVNTVHKESCFFAELPNSNLPILYNFYLLLIPSKDEKTSDIKMQQRLEEQLKGFASVCILIHRMEEFNNALQKGSSFFRSVYKRGTVLYDSNGEQFISPGTGAPINERIKRKENFWHHWYKLSVGFVRGGQFYMEEQNSGLAVFMLHQALQHCYSGMIRVLTGYRTNSNSLRRLLKLVNISLPESSFMNPDKATTEDIRLNNILLKGFSDARYDDTFIVTNEDLRNLYDRILSIIEKGNKVCIQRIADLKDGKAVYIQQ